MRLSSLILFSSCIIIWSVSMVTCKCRKKTRRDNFKVAGSKLIMPGYSKRMERDPDNREIQVGGPEECPGDDEWDNFSIKDMSHTALCPFKYILNFNVNRNPAIIFERRCLCEEPKVRFRDPITGVPRWLLAECHDLPYYLEVEKKDTRGCVSQETEKISVGCTAVRKVIKEEAIPRSP